MLICVRSFSARDAFPAEKIELVCISQIARSCLVTLRSMRWVLSRLILGAPDGAQFARPGYLYFKTY